jgi:hypothetical protein
MARENPDAALTLNRQNSFCLPSVISLSMMKKASPKYPIVAVGFLQTQKQLADKSDKEVCFTFIFFVK